MPGDDAVTADAVADGLAGDRTGGGDIQVADDQGEELRVPRAPGRQIGPGVPQGVRPSAPAPAPRSQPPARGRPGTPPARTAGPAPPAGRAGPPPRPRRGRLRAGRAP